MAAGSSKGTSGGFGEVHSHLLALANPTTDAEALQQHFVFIRDNDSDIALSQHGGTVAWAVRLARKYYDRLHKAYVIVDLSRFEKCQVGMRWRTPKEVKSGKGHFICGAVECTAARHLASFEVPFAYKEHGTTKHALVKARVCPLCAQKLLAASPRGAREAQSSARVQAVLQAARRAHTGGSKRDRSDDPATAVSDNLTPPSKTARGPPRDGKRKIATERSASPSAASVASRSSKASRGAASTSSSAIKGLSDEALLERLLR